MTADIPDLIKQLQSCEGPDWRLDDLVNNTTGHIRRVGRLGLNGGTPGQMRYFGPRSDPWGPGSPPPKPTKTPETRAKAIRALERLHNNER